VGAGDEEREEGEEKGAGRSSECVLPRATIAPSLLQEGALALSGEGGADSQRIQREAMLDGAPLVAR